MDHDDLEVIQDRRHRVDRRKGEDRRVEQRPFEGPDRRKTTDRRMRVDRRQDG